MEINHKKILIIYLAVFLLFLLVAAVVVDANTDNNHTIISKNTVSANAQDQLEESVFINKISRIPATVLP